MKLLPVPGAPGYHIDCENQIAYSSRNGYFRPMSDRTAYRKLNLLIDGRNCGTTIWRMMYCAINGLDINAIPTEFCISWDHRRNRLAVRERKDLAAAANEASAKAARGRRRLDDVLANIKMVRKYYNGDTEPLLTHLRMVEKRECQRLQWMFGVSKTRAEIATSNAVNIYLDELADGYPSFCVAKRVRSLTIRENRSMSRNCEYQEWMKPIEIQSK